MVTHTHVTEERQQLVAPQSDPHKKPTPMKLLCISLDCGCQDLVVGQNGSNLLLWSLRELLQLGITTT